jgi:hypothetical protein
MTPKPENPSKPADEPEEKQLCTACMFPNEPETHFCAKCGAPLTPYAATGPFESLFAEGHVYRQAAERPRSFIVVLGIWMIFGMFGLLGIILVAAGRSRGFGFFIVGALLIGLAVTMIGKTTGNYFAGRRTDEKRDT